MIAAPRLARIVGVFAVGFAALVAATGQASAATCSLSFSPSSSTAGSTLTITASGTGHDLRGTSLVTIGGNGATIQTVSQDAVTVTIPTKTSPRVDSALRVNILFGTSSWGSTSGGDTLAITGANFSPTVSIMVSGSANCDGTFNSAFTYSDGSVTAVDVGGTGAPSFIVNSDSSITATTPPGIAGVTDVLIVEGALTSGTSGSNIFAYVAGGPSVNGVSPQIGLTTVSQSIAVSGQNFVPGTFSAKVPAPFTSQPATSVSFPCVGTTNTAQGPATVVNTGEVTLNSPTCTSTTGGVVNVTVSTPAGSAGGQYQWVAPGTPHVISISPNAGSVGPPISGTTLGGTPVVISGSNFVGTTQVTFGTVTTQNFSVNSAGQISTQTPPQAAAGPVNVTVTVFNGITSQTSTETVTFTYILPAPQVNTVSPNNGSTAGGTSIQIFGQYFTGASCPSGVTIGGTAVKSCTVVSDTEIDAVTAAHAAAAGLSVAVTTSSGTGTGSGLYTYGTPAPTVSSVSPNSGSINGGQSVTITGTFFTGATSVTFGGAAATGLGTPSCDPVSNVCTMTANTPPHAAGIVDVAVTTSAGTGIGTDLYSYAAAPPTVTGVAPATGFTLGGTHITITGTNFTGTPQVTVGGSTAAQVTVVNSTTINAVTPAGAAGPAQVAVTTSFGTSVANGASSTFTYTTPSAPTPPAPTVTGVAPSQGTTLGLTPVTITGTNFTGTTAVTFGSNPATSVVVVSATQITALTPPGALGSVSVSVTNPGGTGTLANAYQYVTVPPTVTAVNPNTGSTLGGTSVTITGTNFTGATGVTFGGVAATGVTVLTATTITATTPAGTGVVDVAVTTPAGTGTGTKLYTYIAQPAPTVTAISPNGGSIANGGTTAGGVQVTITGTNFTGATSVTIGGTAATFVTVVSATQIKATTPAHVPGAADVVVTTPAGKGTGSNLFTYVAGAPTVTGILPATGPIAGGTAVTITGTNFNGATLVTIGGNTPTAVTFVSATTITATTPAHAAGPVNVVVMTPAGTGTGVNLFTYVAAPSVPTVTSVSPNTGVPGGGTNVTITGTNFTNATTVMFGATSAGFFTVVSATSITARSPAGSGTVDVTVTTAVGTSATGTGDQFSYVKATTSLTLTSSPNPSNVGQPVTFTAKVTGNNPTGSVVFTLNGQTIGTAALVSGVATFTIATLPAGSDSITASYPGDINNAPDPETVVQVVNGLSDSAKLRQMQLAVMPVVTNMSGQAISGAIDNAVSAGFSGSCQMVSPNGGGFTYCYDGGGGAPTPQSQNLAMDERLMLPEQRQMLEDDFKALGYAGDPATGYAGDPAGARKAPVTVVQHDWLVWVDVRGADFNRTTFGSDMKGTQVNGIAGITRRFTPDFLVGVLGGYEHFDFTSQAYNGALKGDGYTVGGYLGWRLGSAVRFDASGAWSGISAADNAGTASGNFKGYRWFTSAGVTGTFAWAATIFEPSARVYMLWEQENAYTDSLGTLQASHTFDTGRGSVGLKVSHAFPAGFGSFVPYVGVYGDYYFSSDNAAIPAGLTAAPLLQGGAARATGGVTMIFGGGAQLGVGGEYSGLGQNTQIWNLKVHGSVPF